MSGPSSILGPGIIHKAPANEKPYQRICVPIDFITKHYADASFPVNVHLIVEADDKVIQDLQDTHITRNHNGAGRPYYFIRKLADIVAKSGLGRPQKFHWVMEPEGTIRVKLQACTPIDQSPGQHDDESASKRARQDTGGYNDSPSHQNGPLHSLSHLAGLSSSAASDHPHASIPPPSRPIALPSALPPSSWANPSMSNVLVIPQPTTSAFEDSRYPRHTTSIYSNPQTTISTADPNPHHSHTQAYFQPHHAATSQPASAQPLVRMASADIYPPPAPDMRPAAAASTPSSSVGRSLLARLDMEITIVLRELQNGNVSVDDLRHCMGVMAEQWSAAVEDADKMRSELQSLRCSLEHTESALARAQQVLRTRGPEGSREGSDVPGAVEHIAKALQLLDPELLVSLRPNAAAAQHAPHGGHPPAG